jgi:hypothetical protein
MNAPSPQQASRKMDLGVDDLTQEIEAPLEDYLRQPELTLTKLDFEDLEISFDF